MNTQKTLQLLARSYSIHDTNTKIGDEQVIEFLSDKVKTRITELFNVRDQLIENYNELPVVKYQNEELSVALQMKNEIEHLNKLIRELHEHLP